MCIMNDVTPNPEPPKILRQSPGAEAATDAPVQHRMEDVVRRTGLTPRAIRYYEEMGLLSPLGRTAGGFRLFTEAEIERLLRIKELQTLLGFSLAEIKETVHVDAVRAELRQAYAQATHPAARREIVDQATVLVLSQIRIIDERTARLAKLREEYQERLARLHAAREQATVPSEESTSSEKSGQPETAPAGDRAPARHPR